MCDGIYDIVCNSMTREEREKALFDAIEFNLFGEYKIKTGLFRSKKVSNRDSLKKKNGIYELKLLNSVDWCHWWFIDLKTGEKVQCIPEWELASVNHNLFLNGTRRFYNVWKYQECSLPISVIKRLWNKYGVIIIAFTKGPDNIEYVIKILNKTDIVNFSQEMLNMLYESTPHIFPEPKAMSFATVSNFDGSEVKVDTRYMDFRDCMAVIFDPYRRREIYVDLIDKYIQKIDKNINSLSD